MSTFLPHPEAIKEWQELDEATLGTLLKRLGTSAWRFTLAGPLTPRGAYLLLASYAEDVHKDGLTVPIRTDKDVQDLIVALELPTKAEQRYRLGLLAKAMS